MNDWDKRIKFRFKKRWKNLSNLNGRFTKMVEIREVKKELKKFIKFK